MIKALLLIFAPSFTWERIARARRNIFFILFLFLIPTIALSVAGEIAGRNYFEQQNADLRYKVLSRDFAVRYGALEAGVWLVVVFAAAASFKVLSETFHSRNTYSQCFAAIAYASGPFYLFHLIDIIPVASPWISLAVGIFFSFSTLYYAVPHVLKPDPPHAFGLFLMGGIVLTMLNVLARLFTLQVLTGRLKLF